MLNNFLIKYIANNKILAIVFVYFLFSTVLHATLGIDICIPCLWKSIFGIECPGCGLTTAFICLLKLNFKNAVETNWLILIVLPFATFYLIQDIIKFKNTNCL